MALSAAVRHGLLMGAGHEYRAVRERAAAVRGDAADRATLAQLDVLAIEHLVEADTDEIWPAVLADDPAQPLERWWWHLGAIHARTYPAELLPEPLRSVYRGIAHEAA